MADIDSNVWYQLTQRRVDFRSSLQAVNNHPVKVWPNHTDVAEQWQFLRLNDGHFQIRYRETKLDKQLSTCWFPNDKDDFPSQPCLVEATGGDEQKWMIETWEGSDDYKIQNVVNGTKYNMDTHVDNPVYFEEAASPEATDRPGQHWQFKSIATVDDRSYQTPIVNMPSATESSTLTSASPTGSSDPFQPTESNKSSEDNGLSTGTAIGIAIGCVVAVILVGLAVFFVRRRLKHTQAQARNGSLRHPPEYMKEQNVWSPSEEFYPKMHVAELESQERHEMGRSSPPVEIEGSRPQNQHYREAVEVDDSMVKR